MLGMKPPHAWLHRSVTLHTSICERAFEYYCRPNRVPLGMAKRLCPSRDVWMGLRIDQRGRVQRRRRDFTGSIFSRSRGRPHAVQINLNSITETLHAEHCEPHLHIAGCISIKTFLLDGPTHPNTRSNGLLDAYAHR